MEKGAKITMHIDIQEKGDVHMDTDADVWLQETGVKTAVSIDKQKQEAVCMDTDDIASVETGVKIIMCIDRDKKEPIHMKTDADVTLKLEWRKLHALTETRRNPSLWGKTNNYYRREGKTNICYLMGGNI